jgi:hypothetical protein
MDTVYLANVYGPVAFHGPDGKFAGILNGHVVQQMVDAAKQKKKMKKAA